MRKGIKGIIDLANDLRQALSGSGRTRPGLSANQYEGNLRRLGEASDWGKGRDAVRRAGNQMPGATDDQIDGLLAAMRGTLDRLSKSKAADGANWKSSRAGFDDAFQAAQARAIAAREGAKQVADVDTISAKLLSQIKSEMPKSKNFDDLDGLAEAFSQLGDTPVFDQLVKEGLTQALAEKGVSALLKNFTRTSSVSDLDTLTSRFAASKLRSALNSDPEQIAVIRAAAAEARVRLLKKAYADTGRLATSNPNAASARLTQIDSYIQRRMAGQYPMFDGNQRNALAAARTAAFGKISTSPLLGAQPGTAAPGAARRTVAPRSADADPLARPLGEEPPPMPDDLLP